MNKFKGRKKVSRSKGKGRRTMTLPRKKGSKAPKRYFQGGGKF